MPIADWNGSHVEYRWFEPPCEIGEPPVVLLHEGLGSVKMWRDFPAQLADSTQRQVLAYSRRGYGQSPPLGRPRTVSYMHEEALHHLPELLDKLNVVKPVLFGHSDGASIALIHAGAQVRPISALILESPHVFVEEISVQSIRAAKVAYDSGGLRERLSRYHADVDGAFYGWNDIWLSPEFRSWNIENYLSSLKCPVLAIQGGDDEYGTMEQIDRIARAHADTTLLKLRDCRHSPHRDQLQLVLRSVESFLGLPPSVDAGETFNPSAGIEPTISAKAPIQSGEITLFSPRLAQCESEGEFTPKRRDE
jgi:pimeloyl-ACP methyl ester carboxylesterase